MAQAPTPPRSRRLWIDILNSGFSVTPQVRKLNWTLWSMRVETLPVGRAVIKTQRLSQEINWGIEHMELLSRNICQDEEHICKTASFHVNRPEGMNG